MDMDAVFESSAPNKKQKNVLVIPRNIYAYCLIMEYVLQLHQLEQFGTLLLGDRLYRNLVDARAGDSYDLQHQDSYTFQEPRL